MLTYSDIWCAYHVFKQLYIHVQLFKDVVSVLELLDHACSSSDDLSASYFDFMCGTIVYARPVYEVHDDDDDDDDEGRINFSVALSPKTTRTRNNKLKQ